MVARIGDEGTFLAEGGAFSDYGVDEPSATPLLPFLVAPGQSVHPFEASISGIGNAIPQYLCRRAFSPETEARIRDFIEIMEADDLEESFARYSATFGACSLPDALVCYYEKLNLLPELKRTLALTSFRALFDSIVTNKYQENRYSQPNLHLDKCFESRADLREAWREGAPPVIVTFGDIQPSSSFRILDTDSPDRILLSGTDVPTCQHLLTGDPGNLRGLLNRCIDGKNRFLIAEDCNGKMLAEVPILVLEKCSFLRGYEKLEKLVCKRAAERAQELGLDLIGLAWYHQNTLPSEAPLCKKRVQSLYAPYHFDYLVDENYLMSESVDILPLTLCSEDEAEAVFKYFYLHGGR
jgi:hypothetical protein